MEVGPEHKMAAGMQSETNGWSGKIHTMAPETKKLWEGEVQEASEAILFFSFVVVVVVSSNLEMLSYKMEILEFCVHLNLFCLIIEL